ncbi:hypothetical protein NN561_008906 [Cricetulus griseus]
MRLPASRATSLGRLGRRPFWVPSVTHRSARLTPLSGCGSTPSGSRPLGDRRKSQAQARIGKYQSPVFTRPHPASPGVPRPAAVAPLQPRSRGSCGAVRARRLHPGGAREPRAHIPPGNVKRPRTVTQLASLEPAP